MQEEEEGEVVEEAVAIGPVTVLVVELQLLLLLVDNEKVR